MEPLDMYTIMVGSSLSLFIQVTIMVSACLQHKKHFSGLRLFVIAYINIFLGFTILVINCVHLADFLIILINILSLSGLITTAFANFCIWIQCFWLAIHRIRKDFGKMGYKLGAFSG